MCVNEKEKGQYSNGVWPWSTVGEHVYLPEGGRWSMLESDEIMCTSVCMCVCSYVHMYYVAVRVHVGVGG